MPEYSFGCEKCGCKFSVVMSIQKYTSKQKCTECGSLQTSRLYSEDLASLATSIKKSDNELKTIGDLARRNSERMSDDQKISLYQKHNAYKEEPSKKELPKGMSRIKKPPKPKWPT